MDNAPMQTAETVNGWQVAAVTIQGTEGAMQVAAWRKGNFALDYRVYVGDDTHFDAWNITHIPTGYSVGIFTAPLKFAFEFTEKLEAGADWSFTEPSQAKVVGEQTKKLRDEHGNFMRGARQAFFGPLVKATQ